MASAPPTPFVPTPPAVEERKTLSRQTSRSRIPEISTPSRKQSRVVKQEVTQEPQELPAEVQVPASQPPTPHEVQQDPAEEVSQLEPVDTAIEPGQELIDDPRVELPAFDWTDFEQQYLRAIDAASANEQKLLDEFANLISAFNVWAEVASEKDETRGVKRLKTRVDFVKLSEHALEEKKRHYESVVKAFEAALNMLRG
ncbi:hypothetical protein BP5796_03265 [Coleophoma crateriformis]|uniref:Uncharacterized protein n=1 Tax=Coleophoma crateriformis TaxID=565419 RepID=A0A3D8SN21_9HELO|nr:hypothetical protein BP5796_03265 [Coleophoma crateriformis]